MEEQMDGIVEALQMLLHDNTVPKNVKTRVGDIVAALAEDEQDVLMRVNRALSELDEISDDTNLQSYTRTQIWNIASMLEMM
ncbi:MAG: UPF0147 family protein [Candidatus Nanoarchaeia archaeon]